MLCVHVALCLLLLFIHSRSLTFSHRTSTSMDGAWIGLDWLGFDSAKHSILDVMLFLVVFVVVGRHCRCSLTDSCYIFTLCRFHLNSFCSQSLNALRLCCKNCSLSSHTYVRCIMALIQCTE